VAASIRVPQLHPFDLAAEDTHDEGDQLVAVARLLVNGTDDRRGAAGGVPRTALSRMAGPDRAASLVLALF
jgi:hypothetical protein